MTMKPAEICIDRDTFVVLMRMAADESGEPLTADERALLIGLCVLTHVDQSDGVYIEGMQP